MRWDREVDRTLFLLRRSLQVDGIASGLCGAILLVAAQPVSEFVDLRTPGIALGVGALCWFTRPRSCRMRVAQGSIGEKR